MTSFACLRRKYYHKKHGKCVPVVVQNVTNNNNSTVNNNDNRTVNNHTVNNITNNITNNINITIVNAFDNEDYSSILENPYVIAFINHRQHPNDRNMSEHAIAAASRAIYFNPDHPENHTVKHRNVNLGTMYINRTAGERPEWETGWKDDVLDTMVNKSIAVCSRVLRNVSPPAPETREKAKDINEIQVVNANCIRHTEQLAPIVERPGDRLLVPHGSEDITSITDPEMDRMAFLFEASAAALLCRRHFDAAHSENANLRLRTVESDCYRRTIMEVWRGNGGWEQHDYVTPESAIIVDLLGRAVRDLWAHVDSGRCRCFPDQRDDFLRSIADCFAEPDDDEKTAVRQRMGERLIADLKDASRRRPIMFLKKIQSRFISGQET